METIYEWAARTQPKRPTSYATTMIREYMTDQVIWVVKDNHDNVAFESLSFIEAQGHCVRLNRIVGRSA